MGIDIGSTTVKIVILDENDEIIYKCYSRHLSQVRAKTAELIELAKDIIGENEIKITVTGSAGQGVAQTCGFEFVQEVFVTGEMVKKYYPDTDCVIELGGEDAKIIFFKGGLEEIMNGSCAGGTGAFIDQMSLLLDVSNEELDKLSLQAEKIYMIASRCGVFAKSDIQPLLNQGAKKENIAASIFQAVVDQTITGLAQGRDITGNILFLGGPLYFFEGLRNRFKETLKLSESNAVFPEIAPYAVALGAAISADNSNFVYKYEDVVSLLNKSANMPDNIQHSEPLFKNEEEYSEFIKRHSENKLNETDINTYSGNAYLGVDCGSTTTKIVLVSEDYGILYSYYTANGGNPVDIILEQFKYIRKLCVGRGDPGAPQNPTPKIIIKSAAVTGYGEELIKNAFSIDFGIVETIAHFKAAKYFNPKVNFILDIGGQDIKCFKIKNDAIDNIMLNEACSSGCGSFIESFAKSMGYTVEEFCKTGIYAENPVDLGSRCTVFMNSSVKQAQKEGASIGDISAGLSTSVVKNALYKVIRIHDASELGENIVVQGGTFLNDAILRAFEKKIERNVIRPNISGLMGAFGCAVYAKEKTTPAAEPGVDVTSVLSLEELNKFTHSSNTTNCGLCTNKCGITVNKFSNGKRYISGNKCEKPLGIRENEKLPNMYHFKLDYIKSIINSSQKYPDMQTIGMPLGLNLYEMLPFWHTLWTNLGFNIEVSDISSRDLYQTGQHSIPSDTMCYPAKLIHGHIENLISKNINNIFYPCMTYNFDEKISDNHYNCPVVAYYPELLKANMSGLHNINFMMPYFDVSNKKIFVKKFMQYFNSLENFDKTKTNKKIIKNAIDKAYKSQDLYYEVILSEGENAIKFAGENNHKLIVLCGRPYHIDPEINHGIDKMLNSFGCVIITEEVASAIIKTKPKTKVLNQWTYHARLYNSAEFVSKRKNAELIQLVSFGCGIDAITTDEVREILEKNSKLYTQIKIDEINNLGAAKIRIRSMLAVSGEK